MKIHLIILLVSTLSWAQAPVPPPPDMALPPEMNLPPGAEIPAPPTQPTVSQPESPVPPGMPGTEVFTYDPAGKRDPFSPEGMHDLPATSSGSSEVITQGPVAPEKPMRALEPLENFDLAQIKIQAIIWDTKIPRAMVVDAQGGTHTIRLKTRIGRHNGFVAAIREGEVVVVEYSQENGQLTKSFRILEMR